MQFTLKTAALTLPPRSSPPITHPWWGEGALTSVPRSSSHPADYFLPLSSHLAVAVSSVKAKYGDVVGIRLPTDDASLVVAVVKATPPSSSSSSSSSSSNSLTMPAISDDILSRTLAAPAGVNDVIETMKSLKLRASPPSPIKSEKVEAGAGSAETSPLSGAGAGGASFSLDNLMNLNIAASPPPTPSLQSPSSSSPSLLPAATSLLSPPPSLPPPSPVPPPPYVLHLLIPGSLESLFKLPAPTPLFATSSSKVYVPLSFSNGVLSYKVITGSHKSTNPRRVSSSLGEHPTLTIPITLSSPCPSPSPRIVGIKFEGGRLFVAVGRPVVKGIVDVKTWKDFEVAIGFADVEGEEKEEEKAVEDEKEKEKEMEKENETAKKIVKRAYRTAMKTANAPGSPTAASPSPSPAPAPSSSPSSPLPTSDSSKLDLILSHLRSLSSRVASLESRFPPPAGALEPPPPPVPEWSVAKTSEGREYYVNVRKAVTVWEKPEEML